MSKEMADKQPEVRGMSRRKFLTMGIGAVLGAAATQALPNFAVRGQESKPDQVASVEEQTKELLSMPSAKLKGSEKEGLLKLFPDAKDNIFDGGLPAHLDEEGNIAGLPFDKGSEADNLVQSLKDIFKEQAERGGNPDIFMGIDRINGDFTAVVRDNNDVVESDSLTYTKGSHIFKTSNGERSWLILTKRDGGEGDRLKLLKADDPYKNNLARFGIKANVGEWSDAQVDTAENAQIILLPGAAVTLVDTGNPNLPQVTPTPGTLQEVPTPSAPEYLARVVEIINPWEKAGVTKEVYEAAYNDLPMSLRDKTNLPDDNSNAIRYNSERKGFVNSKGEVWRAHMSPNKLDKATNSQKYENEDAGWMTETDRRTFNYTDTEGNPGSTTVVLEMNTTLGVGTRGYKHITFGPDISTTFPRFAHAVFGSDMNEKVIHLAFVPGAFKTDDGFNSNFVVASSYGANRKPGVGYGGEKQGNNITERVYIAETNYKYITEDEWYGTAVADALALIANDDLYNTRDQFKDTQMAMADRYLFILKDIVDPTSIKDTNTFKKLSADILIFQ